MNKCLHSFAVLVLALGSSVYANADNVVYGLTSSNDDNSYSTTSVDLDALSPTQKTNLASGFELKGLNNVKAGVAVGDKYYAFVSIVDEKTNESKNALVTINFTTGKMVVVNNYSYSGYYDPGYSVKSMTYDKANNTLYATQVSFDENYKRQTDVYSVNEETGEMTKVKTWPGEYKAIAAAEDGTFYLTGEAIVSGKGYYPFASLYKASLTDTEATEVVDNTEVSIAPTGSTRGIMVSGDGKHVYYTAGQYVYTYDLEAKSITQSGTLSGILYGITDTKSSADGKHNRAPKENNRFLIKEEAYGDQQGYVPSDVVSKNIYYYYNSDGKLVGDIEYGREYEGTGHTILDTFLQTFATRNKFNEDGNIVSSGRYQWGMFFYEDFMWKDTGNGIGYTYNDKGQVVAETEGNNKTSYEYNDKGLLVKKTIEGKVMDEGRLQDTKIQEIAYTDFDEYGSPIHYESTGAYDSNVYSADIEYDDEGNKVSESQYTTKDNVKTPKQVERWTYDKDVLTSYVRNNYDENGEEVPARKTLYTAVDGNTNEIAVSDSIYWDGFGWQSASPMTTRLYYSDLSDKDGMYKMKLEAALDEKLPNTVNLKFSLPLVVNMQSNVKFVLYRDNMPIDTVAIDDLSAIDDNMYGYQDKTLKNGTYYYFIQPLVGTAKGDIGGGGIIGFDGEGGIGIGGGEGGGIGIGGGENPDQPEQELEWTGYCVTDPVEVVVNTELPVISDLAFAGGEMVESGGFLDHTTQYFGDVKWTQPEDADKYGFISNSLYLNAAQVATIDTTDVTADSMRVEIFRDTDVHLVTRYQLGSTESNTITLKIDDIKTITGISTVATQGGIKVTFDGKNVTLSENANVSVFAVSGQKVYAANGTSYVDLSTLPSATYLVCVEKNGKVNAYKYNVK